MNRELPDVQAGFRKSQRNQRSNCQLPLDHQKKQESSRKTSTSVSLIMPSPIPDHLTCLLKNLYAGQEATARTGHGTRDWFKIGKRVRQGCLLSLCLFNLKAEYIMRNAGLDEAQVDVFPEFFCFFYDPMDVGNLISGSSSFSKSSLNV